jgi:lysophospholipid acyltransferase (LPLAT)-like uncharacterized protein
MGAMAIKFQIHSVRLKMYSPEGWKGPPHPSVARCIFAVWHESVMTFCRFRTYGRVLISRHNDGEMIAQACKYFGLEVTRGSSRRGGSAALLDLIESSRRHLIITPDGPRGPRRQLNPGVIYLASMTGLPLVLLGVGFSRAKRLRSWDRFAIPWPGSTVCVFVPPAIYVPPNLERDDLEHYRVYVESVFHQVTEAAERWAEGGPHPSEATLPIFPAMISPPTADAPPHRGDSHETRVA